MKKTLSLLSIITTLLFFTPPPFVVYAAAITPQANLTEVVGPSITWNVGAGANTAIFVEYLCRGGTNITGMTFNGVAMTQIEGLTTSSISAGDKYTLWELAGQTGSHTLAVSGGTCSSFQSFSAESFSGVNQTTPYNTSNIGTLDTVTAIATPHITIVTQYTGSILFGSLNCNSTPVADSQTTLPSPNCAYEIGYSSTNPLTVGSNEIGFSNASEILVSEAVEVISDTGTKAGAKFNFWQFLDF